MGNNNSMFCITFDQAQPTIYYTGDIISGKVQFTIQEATNKLDEIYLTITGDVGYTTTRTARMQNGQTDRITDRHDIRIFGEKILLGQTQYNGINSMTNFAPGQYTFPFSIRLPDSLPPTIHPQDYPFVRYELQLIVEKKWYSSDARHRYPLRIHPRVNLLQLNNSQCAVKFDTKNKDITVKGIIKRSGVIPGEQTNISIEIINPSRLTIKRVDICLIQRYEIEQCRRRLEILRLSVPQLVNINNEHVEAICPFTIPIGIPPTYNFKSKSKRSSVHVSVFYDVKLEVKAKGLFSDFELQVPILIGTDSPERSYYTGITATPAIPIDFNAIDAMTTEVDNDGMEPPTYESLCYTDSPSNFD